MQCIHDLIRRLAREISDGDVVKKRHKDPKVKPPRRDKSFSNESNRSDYMKNYMTDYREEGKDYQKIPKSIKELRKKQRKKKKKQEGGVGPFQDEAYTASFNVNYPTLGVTVQYNS